jgi:hypothetical protein
VETAKWSKTGQLDWWVKERREWWAAYVVQTAVNGGSELLIFVPRGGHSPDLAFISSLMTGQSLPIQTLQDGPPRVPHHGRDA